MYVAFTGETALSTRRETRQARKCRLIAQLFAVRTSIALNRLDTIGRHADTAAAVQIAIGVRIANDLGFGPKSAKAQSR